MPVITISSREARTKWRDLLDAAHIGIDDVVIERHGKPIAALIPFQDYLALQEELDELRAVRRVAAAYEEWKQDPSTARPWKEIERELIAEGLLDE